MADSGRHFLIEFLSRPTMMESGYFLWILPMWIFWGKNKNWCQYWMRSDFELINFMLAEEFTRLAKKLVEFCWYGTTGFEIIGVVCNDVALFVVVIGTIHSLVATCLFPCSTPLF